jgi:galacturan 1,4-alpha-galacturonidase
LPIPNPPVRTKQCVVQANGDGSDDSEHILSAFKDCNNGGHVVFSENATYTIGTAMDWTFLKSIDIGEFPSKQPSHKPGLST